MARIELNIVALGNFSSVKDQITALQAQIDMLAKSTAGIGIGPSLTKELNNANAAFKQAMLSTGQFTMQQVALRTETEKFGQALANGKLSLSDYYNIIANRSSAAVNSMKQLAVEQTKLQNSVIISDPTKQGILSVYTPTQIDEVTQATKIATNQANLYALAVDKGSQSLINWGKNTQWAGRQLTVGLTVPLAIFGQQASSAFLSFDKQMTDMLKVYGAHAQVQSQTVLDTIRQQVTNLADNLARTLGVAMSDTVTIAQTFAQMGLEGKDLIQTTDATAKLMKLGGLTAEQSSQAAISLQNVFKIQSSQMADAINFLNAAKHSTSTSMQDIIDALPRVGPIMQQLGGTYKDFATLLVGLRENGVPASQAANAIKSMFASLVNPTAKATQDFQNLGISLKGIVQNDANNPLKMIMDLQAGLDKLPSIERTKAVEELFGKFQFARVEALLDSLGKKGSQTEKVLELYGKSSADLAAVSQQELQISAKGTPAARYQTALQTIKADLIPIGQEMIKISTTLLNFGNEIFQFFNKLPGPAKSLFGAIAIGVALAGPLIMLTGLVGNFVGYLIKGIFNLRQLATGGKTLGQLLTPELIAAQNASQIFSKDILDGVTSTDLLNQSIKNLTISIQGMVDALNVGTGLQNVLQAVGTAATTEIGIYEQLHLPGFASGGTVPGSGNHDSYPALLTPGETVIPKEQSRRYAPFISAMINGKLPGYAYGLDPNGEKINVQRGHAFESHGQDVLEKARALLTTQKRLISVDDVTKGVMVGMTSYLNNAVRRGGSGISSSEALEQLKLYPALKGKGGQNLDPMADLKIAAKKLGADMSKAAPMLDDAYKNLISTLEEQTKNGEFVFGKKAGQVPLEQWMEQQLKPVIEKIDTQFEGNLSNALGKVVTTRGRQLLKNKKEKTGVTGSAYFLDENNNLIPFKKSDLKRAGLAQADIATTGRAATGAISMGKSIASNLESSTKQALEISSPSKKGEKIGQDFVAGINQGITKKVDEDTPWWYKQGESISQEIGNGMSSPASQSTLASKFSSLFGSESKVGSIFGKLSSSTLGKFGLGAAGMMGAQLASPMLNKIPGVGSELSTAASWGSMGLMLGPEAAGIAAAAGFAYSGITHLIQAEREHEAEVKASFTASSDVINKYGGTIQQTTQAVYNFNTGVKQTKEVLSQTAKDVQTIANSKPGDTLKQIGDLLKGQNTASSVVGTVEQFAAAQVAAGMDPSKVQQLVTDLLTYAGKTQYLSQALKEITSNTKDLTTATTTWLSKLSEASSGFSPALAAYKNLSDSQKNFANGLLQMTNDISSGDLSLSQFQSKLTALSSDAANSTEAINLLSSALLNAGQAGAASAVANWGQNLGLNMPEIQLLLAMNQSGKFNMNVPTSLQNDPKLQAEYVKNNILSQKNLNQLFTLQGQQAVNNAKIQLDASKSQISQINIQNQGDTAQIKAWQKKKDLLDKQLKTLKDQTSELQAQQQYQQSQADVDSQIKLAQAQGDYLKAAQLQQQKAANTFKFNTDTQTQNLQAQSDALGTQIANAQAAQQNAQQQAQIKQQMVTAQANYNAAAQSYAASVKAQTPAAIAATVKAVLNLLGLNVTNGTQIPASSPTSSVNLKTNQQNPEITTGFQTAQVNKKTGKITWVNPSSPNVRNESLPLPPNEGMPQFHNPNYKSGDIARGTDVTSGSYHVVGNKKYWFDYTGYVYDSDKKQKLLGQWYNYNKLKQRIAYATGGYVAGPGSWTSDSIPAMLSNGEYVVKAASVSTYGTSMLNAINNRTFNPPLQNNFATSGTISGATYNITVNAGSNASADDIARSVIDTIKRQNAMTQTNRSIRV